jgi:integrase
MGYIAETPEIVPPSFAKPDPGRRRPTFTEQEFQRLRRALDGWLTPSPFRSPLNIRDPNSLHFRQRKILRDVVSFLVRSGLRPGEASQLRWKHIQEESDIVTVTVPKTTKTGTRIVTCLDGAHIVLNRVKEYSGHTEPEDFIFCRHDGTRQVQFNKTFKKFLARHALLRDSNDDARSLYSLRHYYATQMLKNNPKMALISLARNMGTSVKIIETHYAHVQSTDFQKLLSQRIESFAVPQTIRGNRAIRMRQLTEQPKDQDERAESGYDHPKHRAR